MADEVQYMDLDEFREFGYLQEINRRLLHPLGIALEWRDYSEEEWRKDLKEAFVKAEDEEDGEPDLSDFVTAVIALLYKARLVGPQLSGVWDYRDDPEGMAFGGKYIEGEEFKQKAVNFVGMWRQRKRPRVEALRYMVQPSGLTEEQEIGSEIVTMLGLTMGQELSKAIPVKATSESWIKAARGILDALSEKIAEQHYAPDEVTAEEVHVIDLILMPEQVGSARTRLEAINMVVDRGRFYKEAYEEAGMALSKIAAGDLPPGLSAQDVASMALSTLAALRGG